MAIDEAWTIKGFSVISSWYRFARLIKFRGGILCLGQRIQQLAASSTGSILYLHHVNGKIYKFLKWHPRLAPTNAI